MKQQYFAPEFNKRQFTCPYCGVLANQSWKNIIENYTTNEFKRTCISRCSNDLCGRECLWMNQIMVIPDMEGIPYPNDDLSDEIKEDYIEARSILSRSPRGASALLRLGLQKLCKQLGEPGKDINTDIANLVKKGLRNSIQKALDIVRVTGNESVHPGVLDMKDNREIALKLFELVNLIADVMISEIKRVDELYEKVVPEDKKKAITDRDGV
ncbi:MAG: DUF4145 domain-containing protein [Candidatus Woesebacteria bacterium]|nr:DUF4145 domain-containing protein [Candidatus Woesebacteria bacterium]